MRPTSAQWAPGSPAASHESQQRRTRVCNLWVKEISLTDGTASPDLAAIKQRQQATWASGDYHLIGTQILIVSELLIEALDLRSIERVLDVATRQRQRRACGPKEKRPQEMGRSVRASVLYPCPYPVAGWSPLDSAGSGRTNRAQPEPAGLLPRFRYVVPTHHHVHPPRENGPTTHGLGDRAAPLAPARARGVLRPRRPSAVPAAMPTATPARRAAGARRPGNGW
jgi:hypothetical protein